jgi:hypothetical protein
MLGTVPQTAITQDIAPRETPDSNYIPLVRLTDNQLRQINQGIKVPVNAHPALELCLRNDTPKYSGIVTSVIDEPYKCYGPNQCEKMLIRDGTTYCGHHLGYI